MLDVVLKNRNCKREERRFALRLLERQDDEPAASLSSTSPASIAPVPLGVMIVAAMVVPLWSS